MATAEKTAKPARKPAAKPKPKTTLDHLQRALDDLDKARAQAQKEARTNIDDAAERIRSAVSELSGRASSEVRELQEWLEDASEDVRRELGRAAVHAQRTPEAIDDLTSELERRKESLTR